MANTPQNSDANEEIDDVKKASAEGFGASAAVALGGAGASVGNATIARASHSLAHTVLDVGQLYVESRALSEASSAGQVGGSAVSNQARLELSGATDLDTALIAISGDARTSLGGSSQGGVAGLEVISGSPVIITTGALNLSANGSGFAALVPAAGLKW